MEVQDQIYVVAGAGGGIGAILFILTCILFSRSSRLKKDVQRLKSDIVKIRATEISSTTQAKPDVSFPTPAASIATPQSMYTVAQQQPPVTSAAPLLQHTPGNYTNTDTTHFIERERDRTAGGVRVLPNIFPSGDAVVTRKSNYDYS